MATPMIGVLSCRCFQSASLLLHHTVRMANVWGRLSTPFTYRSQDQQAYWIPTAKYMSCNQSQRLSGFTLLWFLHNSLPPSQHRGFHTILFLRLLLPTWMPSPRWNSTAAEWPWAAPYFARFAKLVSLCGHCSFQGQCVMHVCSKKQCWWQWLVHKSPPRRKLKANTPVTRGISPADFAFQAL